MRRLINGKVDLTNPIVKRLVDPLISSTTQKMQMLLTGITGSEGMIKIELSNYRSLIKTKTTETSEQVYVCGLPWQVAYNFTVFDEQNYAINLFLYYSDSEVKECDAEVEFCMRDRQSERNFVRSVFHTFKPCVQYGFRYFAYQREIENPKFGFLMGDTLLIEVTVKGMHPTIEPAAPTSIEFST